jgi:hypothetical protein
VPLTLFEWNCSKYHPSSAANNTQLLAPTTTQKKNNNEPKLATYELVTNTDTNIYLKHNIDAPTIQSVDVMLHYIAT